MALQVWLPLNGDLHNQGLNNIVATNSGATVNNNGKIGQCYSFGTSASYLELPSSAMTNFTDEASICFWLKILSWNSNYATYFQAGTGNNSWASFIFGFLRNSANSTCCFTISNGSSGSSSSYQTSSLELNTWYHIGLTYKAGHCCIYINGTLYKDYSTSIVPDFSKITTITLGVSNKKTAYQSNCLMNDVRIYDHCLTVKEIEEIAKGLILHYKLNTIINNTIYDCSGYNNNGTIIGELEIANEAKNYNNSIYFEDGRTNYIQTPSLYLPSDTITLQFWFKSSNTEPYNSYHMPLESYDGGRYEFSITKSGQLRGGLYLNETRYVANTTTAHLLDGNWHMCSLTYDGNLIKRYVDSEMLSSTEATGTLNTYQSFTLGRYGSNANYGNREAYENDVRIYATALTDDQIKELYNTSMSIDNKGNVYTRELVEQ